jgi:hypothetical protein
MLKTQENKRQKSYKDQNRISYIPQTYRWYRRARVAQ